ncbi:MAG TPA: type II toxin-antitoxin system VapC family toxin [Thermoleophilaceae bacterium]|nr:type II toxin-antitoxin system VapC family toxin [Thermoleophilaceae bacterium]
MSRAFVDASALVKLLRRESESETLVAELARWPALVSSALGETELWIVARRIGASLSRVREVADRLLLVPASEAVLRRAREPFDEPLRTLDAVHLASALSVREGIGVFLAYDSRLLAAAAAEGLEVVAPGR